MAPRTRMNRISINHNIGLIVLLGIILILSGCSLFETQYKGTSRDLMPGAEQIPQSYKLKSEEPDILATLPGAKPSSSLKREYINTDLGCHGFGVYFMAFVYANKDAAAVQYDIILALLMQNKDNPPTEVAENNRMPNVDHSTLLSVTIPDKNSDEALAEVWRVFQKSNVVAVSESYGCVKKDNPQLLLAQRIEETANYAKIMVDKIR